MISLKQKIATKTANVAVIGQGYVGLPLALVIRDAGFFVWGIDKDKSKILNLKSKISYIDDVPNDIIVEAIDSQRFKPTADFNVLKKADVIIIAVPTPLNKYKIPDLSYIESATREIAKRLQKDQLIILESTSYPGTTEEIVLPILSNNETMKQCSNEFYLAFSPERVDPGNKTYTIKNTPKVVGGINKISTDLATLFYQQVLDRVVPVSNAKTAEMTKLLENIFRIVNISMINELTLLCGKMGIDIWEVISAAKTKPYGFMPFYPGPGIGGHCIAVDPFYLSYKAREYGFFTRFIDLAGEINALMPHYVVTRIIWALNLHNQSVRNAKILIWGVSYKKDIADSRESAAYPIIADILKKDAKVDYFDPYIPNISISQYQLKSIKYSPSILKNYDLVVILTNHSGFDYTEIAKNAKLLIDTRNAIASRKFKNVYYL